MELLMKNRAAISGLLLLSFLSVSSGMVYVQTGSDIRLCDMKCPKASGLLEFYRNCSGKVEPLVDYICEELRPINKYNDPSRLHLNTSSGCWTLSRAQRSDSCVYNVHYSGQSIYPLSSTDIRVLDPVLISNISSNSSRLGEDIAVRVHYSGEESAVSWELEGERLPDRYRLIDDNRTLIIPSVQRGDAERRFRVTVTNPVSEETRQYRLRDDAHFMRMLKEEAPDPYRSRWWIAAAVGVDIAGLGFFIRYQASRKSSRNGENLADNCNHKEEVVGDLLVTASSGVPMENAEYPTGTGS